MTRAQPELGPRGYAAVLAALLVFFVVSWALPRSETVVVTRTVSSLLLALFVVASIPAAALIGLDRLVDAWHGRRAKGDRGRSPLLTAFVTGRRDAHLSLTREGEEAVWRHDGHEAGVRVTPAGQLALWVRVDDEQKLAFDLTPGRLPASLRAALRIDAPAEQDALAGLLIGERAEAALHLLFGSFQARRVWLERGLLRIETGLSASVVAATWVEKVIDGLQELASLLGEMRVVVLRTASGAGPAAARCPYCHGAADPAAPEPLTACPSCGTVHHAECWTESQGCTLLGCAGRPRAGIRIRARP